jgi:leader peptidase (prepilin peptidase)/N-methyltransferase
MTAIIFIFGLVIGSFLSVCIYRIPYSPSVGLSDEELKGNIDPETILNESDLPPPEPTKRELNINSPRRSICPKCEKQLLWWHNIPLLSWILLRGKCAFCKAPISARYPFVELLTGALALLSYLAFEPYTAALVFAICAVLLVIAFIDYDFYIIPNMLSIPGTFVGLGIAALNQYFHIFSRPIATDLTDAGIGILCGAGFLLFVSEVYLRLRKQEGLGMGDVKLLAFVGAFFGYQASIFTIMVGSLLGTIGGVVVMLFLKKKFSHPLPFGPYLILATLFFIFYSRGGGPNLFPDLGLLF